MTKKLRSHKELGDTVILYADNYLNDIEGEKLEEMCDAYITKGFKRIIIDFSGTELINSIGVSILIGVIEKMMQKKCLIVFSGLKRINFDIFNIVGLTKHIQVYKTEEEALGAHPDGHARM